MRRNILPHKQFCEENMLVIFAGLLASADCLWIRAIRMHLDGGTLLGIPHAGNAARGEKDTRG
jgi:hypothetical protein